MRKFLCLAIALGLLWPVAAEKLTGRQIMETVVKKATWKDMTADLTLIIVSSKGSKRVRKIKMYSRKRTEEESDMLMRFISPPDVAGTGFLLIEHADRDDDRYLYLPALRRVKRIASSGKGGSFMGSDFSYYDIGRPKLKDWRYRRLADEVKNGVECFKVEALPASKQVEKDTRYSKIIHWIDKKKWTTIYAEYYDRTGQLWKVLEVPEVKKIGGIWFQTHMIMKDVQAGRHSEMIFENIKINQNLPAKYFTKRYLLRWH